MKLSSFILGSMSLLIQQYADKYKADDLSKTLNELESDLSLPKIETFDFIVVGGGTAGCLIAGRLSENFKVLLLESGGSPVPTTYNPYLFTEISSHPAINNKFVSLPQYNFTQEDGGIVVSHTGRMLGGSGSHNGNVYNRGSPKDYDYFASVTNDSSWEYSNVLKHFKNLENFVGKLVLERNRGSYYGTNGKLTVDTDTPPILASWFQSGREMGYKSRDPNGFQTESFTPMAKTVKNGERSSTYTAFIKPFESTRKSLTVFRYSEVEEVLISKNNVAYGVRYRRHGIPQISHASKEVIISCGTFSSPLLLMKSGIGSSSVLHEANIQTKSDLPGVGMNLRDHAAVILQFTANNPNKKFLPKIEQDNFENKIKNFQGSSRQGLFTNLDVGPQALLVSSRAKSDGEVGWPDIQLVFQHVPLIGDGVQKLNMQVVINRLKSIGEIRLNTTAFVEGETDDTKLALIDHRLFTEKTDADVLIEAIKLGLEVMEETTAFKSMNVTYSEDRPESCAKLEFRSDKYWRCYISQRAYSWLHVTGTCKMGSDVDPEAVVDSKLRVKGIDGLRVVDASVLPRPTNVNTNAATMLVAEKTVNEIFSQYQKKGRKYYPN